MSESISQSYTNIVDRQLQYIALVITYSLLPTEVFGLDT